jgi:hypothetical protein
MSTALLVPRLSIGVGTFVAWLERLLKIPRAPEWISELFT